MGFLRKKKIPWGFFAFFPYNLTKVLITFFFFLIFYSRENSQQYYSARIVNNFQNSDETQLRAKVSSERNHRHLLSPTRRKLLSPETRTTASAYFSCFLRSNLSPPLPLSLIAGTTNAASFSASLVAGITFLSSSPNFMKVKHHLFCQLG